MKILHLNFSFTSGGIDTMMVDIINHQIKTCKVELAIINDLINYEILNSIDKEVKIYLIKRPQGSVNPWYIAKLNWVICRIRPDLIHCHNNRLSTVLFTSIKKGLTIHALDLSIKNLRKFDQLFAISDAVKMDIKKRGNLDSIIIHNGINFNLLNPVLKHRGDTSFRVVQVSRLDHLNGAAKGQHILIRAIDIIIRQYKITDISVDFIGEGPSYDFLLKLTIELGLSDRIHFLGNQSRAYIYTNLPQYDLLVQPSLNEGFGLTILEGIGSNIPVLASNTNGPAEISKTLNYDFLFETGNSEDLALSILKIYKKKEDPQYLNELLNYGQRARSLFSIEQTANNYLKAYQHLIY